ncbi:MAG: Lrp/AsnC ligand binding domain-containing protein [Bacteroidales bacterium]|nr:Lrp/AsnC ligand binding domain-containing protein [Bacteroidales bacterium]
MAAIVDEIDRKIIDFLTKNARISFTEIARECGVSSVAIHQRVSKLEDAGVFNGSCFLVNENTLGYTTCAYIGVNFEKGGVYQAVLEELNEIPEVVECHYTTGKYGLLLKIYAKDNSHLMHILSHQIQAIPGISSTETFISLEIGIQRQVTL